MNDMKYRITTPEICRDCIDGKLNTQGRCCTKYCPLYGKELRDEGL